MRDLVAAIRSAKEFADRVRHFQEAVDLTQIARQFDWMLRSSELAGFADSVLRQQHQLDDFVRPYRRFLDSLDRAAHQFEASALAIDKWAPIYAEPDFLRVTAERARYYDALFRSPSFVGVFDEISRLQDFVAPHIDEIQVAPDEKSRRLSLRSALQAILKGAMGLDTRLDSPEKAIELVTALIRLVIMLYLSVQSSHRAALATAEASQRQTVQREQAETIASLSAMLGELRDRLASVVPDPVVILRTTDWAVLREGPAGSTAKLITLPPGQRVRLRSSYQRWHWVEI